MKQAGLTGLALTALVAVGVAGYWAGQRGPALSLPWLQSHPMQPVAVSAPSGPVIYYRDPEGLPAYAAAPKKRADGRDFVPVHASEDVSFDTPASGQAPPVAAAVASSGEPQQKKLLYYRNPMGLPDTSPVPKKDSMGMDYIPVYAGDDDDGPGLKLSPGKLQRTGVRSEPAAMRTLSTPVRASGTVQLDERRKSVIALRFDAYIDKVDNITTGSMVRQGQPLMQVYGPDLLIPAAQYVSAFSDRTDPQGLKSARRRLENFAVPETVIAQIERSREVPAVAGLALRPAAASSSSGRQLTA